MLKGYRANIVVSRSLEECMKRIQQFNEGNIYWSNRVRFWNVDKTTLDYEIRMWRSMYLLGTISGEIVYQDNQSTLVTTKADLSLQLQIGIPIYLLVAILFTLSDLLNGRFPLGLLFILWGVLWWLIWTWKCNLMAEYVINQIEQV